ncbi:TonB-dependent receptor plug domain-containing protein [Sphingobium sp. MK2]|uniref:TonB-dependent receptor plug domain-containing protein n=1 Tax=Sphingobium sp. MK2 TaxID=3116540 RepID=UPI0032E3624C
MIGDNSLRHVSTWALAMALFGSSGVTQAQIADETSASSRDYNAADILVTARKRQENIVDVPLAVSIVGAAQLERDQVYNLTDLARTTPALEINQAFGGESNGGGRLRGIGTGVFNPSPT